MLFEYIPGLYVTDHIKIEEFFKNKPNIEEIVSKYLNPKYYYFFAYRNFHIYQNLSNDVDSMIYMHYYVNDEDD